MNCTTRLSTHLKANNAPHKELIAIQRGLAAAWEELDLLTLHCLRRLITTRGYWPPQRLVVLGIVVATALLLLFILLHQLRMLLQAMPSQCQLQLLPGAAVALMWLIVLQLQILHGQHDEYEAGELQQVGNINKCI